MALSGIQIYKLLPQTNCKDCEYPTCLAFAMKLAAKQAELASCPHVSDEAKEKLSEAAAPPVKPITLKSDGYEIEAGNEVVLFRHEKKFFNRSGLFIRIYDDEDLEDIKKKVSQADKYNVDYVGIDLSINGFAIQANDGDFSGAIAAVREVSNKPLILIGETDKLEQGLSEIRDEDSVLLCHADNENWKDMVSLAEKHKSSLAVAAGNIDEMVELVGNIKDTGFDDLVLSPEQRSLHGTLTANTMIRRLALKKTFRPMGHPVISFPGDGRDKNEELVLAAQAIGKYSSFIVLDHFNPASAYPLLVLRENIYTDPQKPIQVKPGLYEINDPKPEDPVLVTTNFSITYFSVANEVEGAGIPAWLLVTDAEGMSVLTAWAAGKFDSERIARDVKEFKIADKISNKLIVLPGHVAVLSGEVEEELPGWKVVVGPREAVDLPKYMKEAL